MGWETATLPSRRCAGGWDYLLLPAGPAPVFQAGAIIFANFTLGTRGKGRKAFAGKWLVISGKSSENCVHGFAGMFF